MDCANNGIAFRILDVIDEYTRECLAVRVRAPYPQRCVGDVDWAVIECLRAMDFEDKQQESNSWDSVI